MAARSIVILFTALLFAGSHAQTLEQIHIVTRHGARFPLTKDPEKLVEGTTGTLTPAGIQQMRRLGYQLREEYESQFDFLPTYVPARVRFESSDKDRTLSSAQALGEGLFQSAITGKPYIPIHTSQPQNDVYLRAYDKCEALWIEFERLYETDEWKQLEDEHRALLTKLANVPVFSKYQDWSRKIPLTHLWNVYDAIYVAKFECGSSATDAQAVCASLEDPFVRDVLSDDEFQQLEQVISQTETMKYNSPLAGRLVGNNLLRKIVHRMLYQYHGVPAEDGGASIYLYSGHFPGLLGLMAALGHRYEEDMVPQYAAAVVMELYSDNDDQKYVSVKYYPGEGLQDMVDRSPIQLYGPGCPDMAMCDFVHLNEMVEHWTEVQWCHACGSGNQADICSRAEQVECEERRGLTIVGGTIIGLLTGWLSMMLCRSRNNNGKVNNSLKRDSNKSTGTSMTAEEDNEREDARSIKPTKSEELVFHESSDDEDDAASSREDGGVFL